MTKEQLIEIITDSSGNVIPLSTLIQIWPRYEDDDFVETGFVGPRPRKPPHNPPDKIPTIENETE